MSVLVPFLCLTLCLAPQEPVPSADEVEAALEALAQGFASEELVDTLQAIERSVRVRADAVAEHIIRLGLRHRERDVRLAALEGLADLALEPGRKALERLLRRERDLTDDPEEMIAALRSLARHRDERSVPVLADLARSGGEREIVTARILCLGHIRRPESVEALFGAMKKAGPQDVQRHMPDFRLSLMMLVGVDRGLSQDEWMAWWNTNKKELNLSAKEPRLPDPERERWRRFWGLEPEYPRPERRGERGK